MLRHNSITVPVTPVIRLEAEELKHVEAFVRALLEDGSRTDWLSLGIVGAQGYRSLPKRLAALGPAAFAAALRAQR